MKKLWEINEEMWLQISTNYDRNENDFLLSITNLKNKQKLIRGLKNAIVTLYIDYPNIYQTREIGSIFDGFIECHRLEFWVPEKEEKLIKIKLYIS